MAWMPSSKVFLKVFNELAGYCGDFRILKTPERELDKRGQFGYL